MKKFHIIILILSLILFACKGEDKSKSEKRKIQEKKKNKIGLGLGVGGLGDQSFNDMQYNGLIEVSKKFNVDIVYIAPTSGENKEMLRVIKKLAVEEKCNFVIGGSGWLMKDAIDRVAKDNPGVNFVLLDDFAKPRKNVSTIIYAQHEGSFVVGVLAAKMTKTKKIGFIGGVDMGVVKAFLKGFQEGIQYVDPSIKLEVAYCSYEKDKDWTGFDNPKKGYQMAKQMYNKGIDIIYSVAGATGNGIIQAASDQKKYVIGVDANQDHMAPGYVLTSMMKRLDNSIVDICSQFIQGKFKGNHIYLYGYKNKGVSITEMKYTKDKIPKKVLSFIRGLEKKIAEGKIKVTNLLKK